MNDELQIIYKEAVVAYQGIVPGLGFQNDLVYYVFSTNVYASIVFSMRATCPVPLILLNVIIL
jgi:hypothetical protein